MTVVVLVVPVVVVCGGERIRAYSKRTCTHARTRATLSHYHAWMIRCQADLHPNLFPLRSPVRSQHRPITATCG